MSVEDEGADAVVPGIDEAALLDGPVESGMGLAIVRAVMDEVGDQRRASATGTVVRMRKQLATP